LFRGSGRFNCKPRSGLLTLASNQLLSLPALAEALTANTLKASMDTDGDGFIDATELLAWKANAPAARALRSLTVANNPFLDRLLDARLRIIHAIPTLAILDEIDVTPEETVACKGLHGADAAQLLGEFLGDLGGVQLADAAQHLAG
jgi:hypothetical protein